VLHLGARVRERKLAAADAADLALLLERAERLVDVPESVEHLLGNVAVAGRDDDRHPHDVLDPVHQVFFAWRIAACRDPRNAYDVAVAPPTSSMFGLNCVVVSTSCVRSGIACWLMNTDRSVWFG
jgi:hypothetical protein